MGWFRDNSDEGYADAVDPQQVTKLNESTDTIGIIAANGITVTYATADSTEPGTVTINSSMGDTLTISAGDGVTLPEDACFLKNWNTNPGSSGETHESRETAAFAQGIILYAQTTEHVWGEDKVPANATCTEGGHISCTCLNDAAHTEI